MLTKTEVMEEKTKRWRQNKLNNTRRILDCFENQRDYQRCIGCSDRPVCRQLQEAIF